ncbi:MAG TPA: thermonuclease family protein [archaeon]|nr:thermonuclease family protein [archaeon]
MKKNRIRLPLIFLIVILVTYGINVYFPGGVEHTYITKVIDGDTIVVAGGQSIRLLNIDTRERGQNCYQEAKDKMTELVLLKNITMERDKEDKDRYNRLLRYIYVDGEMVNLKMVQEGLAVVYIIPPNGKYRSDFEAAESAAHGEGGCVWTMQP